MKVYIAGKITGLDYEEAESYFMFASTVLEKAGHTPINPLDKVSEQEGKSWVEYMCEDMAFVLTADALYMLSNWQDSKGARVEHAVARELGLPIFYAASEIPKL